MKKCIGAIGLICLLTLTGFAKPIYEMDLKDSHVEVPWNEFKSVIEKTAKPVVETVKDTVYSPVDYLITGAKITGTVYDHKVVRFTANCNIDVPLSRNINQNGWIILPLGADKSGQTNGAVLESAELNERSVPVENRNGLNRILISQKGRHALKLKYYVPIISEEGTWSFTCNFPAAASANFKLTIPNSRAEIYLNGTKRKARPKGGATVLETPISLDNEVTVRYSLIGDDQGVMSGMAPKLFAETGMLVTIKENRIDYRYRVQYQIWHQNKKTFELLLPDSLPVESVHGAGLTSWKVEKRDAGSVLVASIGFVPERDYSLTVEFSQKLETVQSTVKIPKLSVLGVNRESGFVAVQAPKTVEVFTDNMKELSAVSNRELPNWLQQEQELLMRFKYTRPFDLNLSVRRHKDMPVLVAIADEATFTGLITEDGYRLVKYRYFIRNNHKQYLALTMSKGWELWSALIDGEAVMPAASGNNQTVQIPLKKLSKIDEGSGFTLELVYWYEGEPLGKSGRIKMETPVVDINCQKLNGELWVPSIYNYSGFKGSLEHIKNAVQNTYLDRSEGKSGSLKRVKYRQMAQMNLPIQANSLSLNKKGKSLSLPVEIDIPNSGTSLRFSRTLTVDGEVGEYSFSYGKPALSLQPVFQWLIMGITLLFGYLSLKLIFSQIASHENIVTAFFIFIGGFILLLIINSVTGIHAQSLVGTVILSGVGALITTLESKSRKGVA